MKRLIFIFVLLIGFVAAGQRVLVTFYGDNSPFQGLTNYPARTLWVSFSTNAPGWQTNMSADAYTEHLNGLHPAYLLAESNAQYEVQLVLQTNVAKLAAIYSQIPDARTNFAEGRALLSVIDSSLASGTNSQAQVVARIRQMATIQDQSIRYLDGIAEILQRLAPVLKPMYSPQSDLTP